MRVLAFDTSGPALSAAAGAGGVVLARCHERLDRGHAERLLPVLTSVMAGAGWRWADLELVAVTLGPGNFTGLRAGIAVARALGLSLGCATLGLGTLEVVAQAAASRVDDGGRSILAVLDARRAEVYAQPFDADLTPLAPPALLRREDVAGALAAGRLLVGDPAAWAGTGLEGVETFVDAEHLLTLAWRRLVVDASLAQGTVLRPLYLRPPDARLGAGASLLAAVP